MATEEKSAWIMLILAIAAYTTYLILLLGQVGDAPLTEAPYVWPLVWTILGSIVASIVLHIFFAPQMVKKDQRDREIGRFAEAMGSAFVIIGALGAMVLALFDVDGFWIANLVYLCFILSALVSNVAKIIAYRRGVPRW